MTQDFNSLSNAGEFLADSVSLILQALMFDRALVCCGSWRASKVHGFIYARPIGANVCDRLLPSSSMQGTHHEHSRARQSCYPSSGLSKYTRLDYLRGT